METPELPAEEQPAVNTPSAKRWLAMVVAGAVLVSASGVSFYAGRVSVNSPEGDRPFVSGKAAPIDEVTAGEFGILPNPSAYPGTPMGAGISEAFAMPSRGPAGRYGPMADPASFGGLGEVQYVWKASDRELPADALVYQNKPNGMTEEKAKKIGEGLGFTRLNSIVTTNPATADESYSYQYGNESTKDWSFLSLSSSTFSYHKGDYGDLMMIDSKSDSSKKAPRGDKAIEIAKSWLVQNLLMPPGDIETKVEPSFAEMQSKYAPGYPMPEEAFPDEPTYVTFTGKINGKPLYQNPSAGLGNDYPLVTVEIGTDGEVKGADGFFVDALVAASYPLEKAEKALAGMPREQSPYYGAAPPYLGGASMMEGPKKLVVGSVAISYMPAYGAGGQVFFEPIYVFKGTLEWKGGRQGGIEVTAPAVKSDRIEKRKDFSGGGSTSSVSPSGGAGVAVGAETPPDYILDGEEPGIVITPDR
ncbi:MAG: hypothetical protein ACYC1U_06595 [Candidatus Aquicultorales bacterium]